MLAEHLFLFLQVRRKAAWVEGSFCMGFLLPLWSHNRVIIIVYLRNLFQKSISNKKFKVETEYKMFNMQSKKTSVFKVRIVKTTFFFLQFKKSFKSV